MSCQHAICIYTSISKSERTPATLLRTYYFPANGILTITNTGVNIIELIKEHSDLSQDSLKIDPGETKIDLFTDVISIAITGNSFIKFTINVTKNIKAVADSGDKIIFKC